MKAYLDRRAAKSRQVSVDAKLLAEGPAPMERKQKGDIGDDERFWRMVRWALRLWPEASVNARRLFIERSEARAARLEETASMYRGLVKKLTDSQ